MITRPDKTDNKILKIAVEAFSLSDNNISGVGNVIFNYLKELQRIDKNNHYIIYTQRSIKHIDKSITNWKYIDWKFIDKIYDKAESANDKIKSIENVSNTFGMTLRIFSLRIIKNLWIRAFKLLFNCYELWMPFSLRKNKIDIYIGSSAYFFPYYFLSKLKKIIIVYDIVWKLYPETMNFKTKFMMKLFAKKNLERADMLTSISESTRRDVAKILNVNTECIAIPLAADRDNFYKAPKPSINKIRDKYNINKKYILSVCTLEPRKNLISLLHAYAMMKDYEKYQLVLVGQIGWIQDEFFNLIEQIGIKNNVLITGYVPTDDLAPLYSGAEVFAFPSLYEGFGLPVLESMQCGCPVITSNSSSIPEVIGDAGIMVEAQDQNELCGALEKVLSSSTLRKEMSKKGLHRAEIFSWEKSAGKLMKLLEHICSNRL